MPSKLQSILLAGAAMGIAAAVFGLFPVLGQCLVCVAYIGAGVLAVWHYTTTYGLTVSGGTGAGMGAAAGVAAAIASSLVNGLLMLIGLAPSLAEARREALRQMEDSGMTGEQLEMVRGIVEGPSLLLVGLLCGIVIAVIVGAIGGAIGASIFKKGGEPPTTTQSTI